MSKANKQTEDEAIKPRKPKATKFDKLMSALLTVPPPPKEKKK